MTSGPRRDRLHLGRRLPSVDNQHIGMAGTAMPGLTRFDPLQVGREMTLYFLFTEYLNHTVIIPQKLFFKHVLLALINGNRSAPMGGGYQVLGH